MFSNSFKNKIAQINDNSDDFVALSLIDFDTQYRQDKSQYDLEGLAENIYELSSSSDSLPVGLKQRPTLTKKDNGRFLVDDGEMRVRAFMLLAEKYPDDPRWQRIPYSLSLDSVDNRYERDLFQLSANLFRDAGSIFDIAHTITKLVKELGQDRVSSILRKNNKAASKTAFSRYKKIDNAEQVIKDDVNTIELRDLATIATLIDLHKVDSQAYQQLIADYQANQLNGSLYNVAKAQLTNLKQPVQSHTVDQSQVDSTESDLPNVTKEQGSQTAKPTPKPSKSEETILVASNVKLTRELLTVVVDGKTLKFAITSESIVNTGV